jgi:hypothetical protein
MGIKVTPMDLGLSKDETALKTRDNYALRPSMRDAAE